MPSLNHENPKVFTSHTLLVLRQIKFQTLQLLRRREVNERLCIKEVGVDLELCVHAHGPDVELIMEASCINNYFLDIISFGNSELILCNCGSDHDCSSLIPFLGEVKTIVSYRSMCVP